MRIRIHGFYMQPITYIPANGDEIFTWQKSQTKENCKVRDLKINKSENITSQKIKKAYRALLEMLAAHLA